MKPWSNSYHMLVASLPPLPPRLDGRLPISFERLQSRLSLLEADDAAEMGRMLAVFHWSRQFEEAQDAAVVKRYDELMRDIVNPLVREVLTKVIDVRMITTALRRRRRGLGPPSVGVGQLFEQTRRRFTAPDFGLSTVYPGIRQLGPRLEAGDVLNVYRGLGEANWTYLKRRADDYSFSFEAVVLYVARWSVMLQWQQLDADRGRPVFEALVTEALGEHANVYC